MGASGSPESCTTEAGYQLLSIVRVHSLTAVSCLGLEPLLGGSPCWGNRNKPYSFALPERKPKPPFPCGAYCHCSHTLEYREGSWSLLCLVLGVKPKCAWLPAPEFMSSTPLPAPSPSTHGLLVKRCWSGGYESCILLLEALHSHIRFCPSRPTVHRELTHGILTFIYPLIFR